MRTAIVENTAPLFRNFADSERHSRLRTPALLLLVTTAVVLFSSVPVLVNLGNIAFERATLSVNVGHTSQMRDRRVAQALFQRALALRGTNALAYAGLGRVYAVLQEYDAAAVAFETSVRLDSSDVNTFFDLANVFDAVGERDRAIGAWKRAGAAQYFLMWGERLRQSGRTDLSEAKYRLAVAVDSNDPRAYYALGDLHWYPGRLEEAVSWYRQALAVDTLPSVRALLSQGHVAAYQGQWDEAIRFYEAGLYALGDGDAYRLELWYGLGNAYYFGKMEYGQARGYYLKLHEMDPGNIGFYGLVGHTYRDEGYLDRALAWYQWARIAFPDNEYPLVWLGMVKLAEGDLDGAEALVLQALEQNQNNAEAHARLGQIHARHGERQRAAYEFGQAVTLSSDPREYTRLLNELTNGVP